MSLTMMALSGDGASSFSRTTLSEVLRSLSNKTSSVFMIDGGTGEELIRRGIPNDRRIWSATAIVRSEFHSTLEHVHTAFLAAGSQAITTNSYGIVPGVGFHNERMREEYIAKAGEIARRAVEGHNNENKKVQKDAYVLGSLGPLVESYRPDLIRDHERGVEDYRLACRALQPYVDAFLAETMSCSKESFQALEAASSFGRPCLVSFTLNSRGYLRDGQTVTDCLTELLNFCEKKRIELLAIMFNCCEPEALTIALGRVRADNDLSVRLKMSKVLLGAYANRLLPVDPNWSLAEADAQPIRNDLDPQHYWDDFVSHWTTDFGAQVIGGCCGITPEHISYLRERLEFD